MINILGNHLNMKPFYVCHDGQALNLFVMSRNYGHNYSGSSYDFSENSYNVAANHHFRPAYPPMLPVREGYLNNYFLKETLHAEYELQKRLQQYHLRELGKSRKTEKLRDDYPSAWNRYKTSVEGNQINKPHKVTNDNRPYSPIKEIMYDEPTNGQNSGKGNSHKVSSGSKSGYVKYDSDRTPRPTNPTTESHLKAKNSSFTHSKPQGQPSEFEKQLNRRLSNKNLKTIDCNKKETVNYQQANPNEFCSSQTGQTITPNRQGVSYRYNYINSNQSRNRHRNEQKTSNFLENSHDRYLNDSFEKDFELKRCKSEIKLLRELLGQKNETIANLRTQLYHQAIKEPQQTNKNVTANKTEEELIKDYKQSTILEETSRAKEEAIRMENEAIAMEDRASRMKEKLQKNFNSSIQSEQISLYKPEITSRVESEMVNCEQQAKKSSTSQELVSLRKRELSLIKTLRVTHDPHQEMNLKLRIMSGEVDELITELVDQNHQGSQMEIQQYLPVFQQKEKRQINIQTEDNFYNYIEDAYLEWFYGKEYEELRNRGKCDQAEKQLNAQMIFL